MSDHAEFLAFTRRIMRALSRRIGDADPEDLALMCELASELDAQIVQAVLAQRATGTSWTDIARPLGITRQAARQKWARYEAHMDTPTTEVSPA